MYRKTLSIATFFILTLGGCEDPKPLKQEIQKLNSENSRLQKEITDLKSAYSNLEKDNVKLSFIKDTLSMRLKKQEELAKLQQKAKETPLEMSNIAIQNENVKGEILQTKSPFKKKEVRYLCFNTKLQNNVAKIGNTLNGKLYAIYRVGTLVQRMAEGGTFMGDDGKKYIFTTFWDIKNTDKTLNLDKGIGDKSNGIFEKGNWTLELWFEEKGKGSAYKLGAVPFVIN